MEENDTDTEEFIKTDTDIEADAGEIVGGIGDALRDFANDFLGECKEFIAEVAGEFAQEFSNSGNANASVTNETSDPSEERFRLVGEEIADKGGDK